MPCKTEEILTHHYGSENGWKSPIIKGYKMHNAQWGNGEARTIQELPYMYRYYHLNGTLRLSKTLESINNLYLPLTGKRLTRLPTNEDEFL